MYRSDLSHNEFPNDPHPHLLFSAKDQGQISCLVKKSSLSTPIIFSMTSETDSAELTAYKLDLEEGNRESFIFPPGTAPCNTGMGYIKTCSDKIAIWNAVGIQGALLSHLLHEPIYLNTITIGRKYSKVHAGKVCR